LTYAVALDILLDFAMRTRADRRWNREVKAWRRIKEDRAQHGQSSASQDCPCFGDEDPAIWGRTFARFADTPKTCGCWMCGNPRRYGDLTVHERRSNNDMEHQLAESSRPNAFDG
jgi:hypothetical protein